MIFSNNIASLLVSTVLVASSYGQIIRGSFYERMLSSDLGVMCSNNPVCAVQGFVEGACCPNEEGEYHACCNRECSLHSECSQLTGKCCPTIDNVELNCCDHQAAIDAAVVPSSSPSSSPSISPTVGPTVAPTVLSEAPSDISQRSSENSLPALQSFGGEPPADRYPLQLCQGDCDRNSDCDVGLKCFQRGFGGREVPGCRGGEFDYSKTDYCIPDDYIFHHPLASSFPSASPSANPSSSPSTSPSASPSASPSSTPSSSPSAIPSASPSTAPSASPSDSPTEVPSASPTTTLNAETIPPINNNLCRENSKCEALGLVGHCCPTMDGITLDCCDDSNTSEGRNSDGGGLGDSTTAEEASCSSSVNPMCHGLTGNCCPTDDGVQLACCGN